MGPVDNMIRHACKPGYLDAVAAVGRPFDQFM